MFKGVRRHIGVPHNIVWLPNQLFLGEATDLDEVVVNVSDMTLGRCSGEDVGARREL